MSVAGPSLAIDAVTFEFFYTPNAEAPSEMVFHIPEWRALTDGQVFGISLDANTSAFAAENVEFAHQIDVANGHLRRRTALMLPRPSKPGG